MKNSFPFAKAFAFYLTIAIVWLFCAKSFLGGDDSYLFASPMHSAFPIILALFIFGSEKTKKVRNFNISLKVLISFLALSLVFNAGILYFYYYFLNPNLNIQTSLKDEIILLFSGVIIASLWVGIPNYFDNKREKI